MRWAVWELSSSSGVVVTVGYRLHPQPGWDHFLDLRTTYVLDDAGLTVTTAARNVGPTAAPFGYGAHPYLATGRHAAARGRAAQVPAATWVEVDDRLLPSRRVRRRGQRLRLPRAAAVGDPGLDTAYTDVVRDADGVWRCTVDRRPTAP